MSFVGRSCLVLHRSPRCCPRSRLDWPSGGADGASAVRLTVVGELDLATVPDLAAPLCAAIRTGRRDVTVDMREVNFCDPAGLRLLTETAPELRAQGSHLIVYGPCPALEILLEVLAQDTAIEVCPAPPD
ncbi:STAS domain-containing protein [Georgenia sp. 10Sc9-8]|uniref:STAS domain-containing protein n=1 Tax=Georgenia halotolerans TaxID=3028317 RepID=A0ABT5TU84_9MICO|nr:STAS domain-containing protein [Georgenia halotolerans]